MCELALTCDPLVRKGLFAVATIFSASILGHFPTVQILKWSGHKTSDMGGKWIGFVERALIALFVLLGLTSQATFLFATKAAVIGLRMPRGDKDKKKTVEYMLVGTMTSFFFALVISYLCKEVWGALKWL